MVKSNASNANGNAEATNSVWYFEMTSPIWYFIIISLLAYISVNKTVFFFIYCSMKLQTKLYYFL